MQNFPFLTNQEFITACSCLAALLIKNDKTLTGDSIFVNALSTSLRISKYFLSPRCAPSHMGCAEDDCNMHEEDEEALLPTSLACKQLHAMYNIVLSPSYGVPILYFTLRDLEAGYVARVDDVYDILVPSVSRDSMKKLGVMGAISSGDDPTTGSPAFFVHPCNTAYAMGKLAEGIDITLETYLSVWLGIVGSTVGLELPMPD